jgi:hypothetical protein
MTQASQESAAMVTPDGKWISFDGGETFSLVPGHIPEPPRTDWMRVDDEGRPRCPYFCEQCGEAMFYGPANAEGRPTHKPCEDLTLVIDHRMHCSARSD